MEKNLKNIRVSLNTPEQSINYGELYDRLGFCNQTKDWSNILSKYISKKESVLILGAGTGSLSVPLSKEGWHIIAIEMNNEVFSVLKKNSNNCNITLYHGRFQDYFFKDLYFSCIIAPSCLVSCFGRKQLTDFFEYVKYNLHIDGMACFEIINHNLFNSNLFIFSKQELSTIKINELNAKYSISYLFDDCIYTDLGHMLILNEEYIKECCIKNNLFIVEKYKLTLITDVYIIKKII